MSIILSRRYYPSESVSSKWHVCFASCCLARRFPTWQMIAASCPNSTRRSLHGAANTQQLRWQNFGPCLWNSLPLKLRNPDIIYGLFRRQLKKHLFWETWTQHSVTSHMWRLRKTLTYRICSPITLPRISRPPKNRVHMLSKIIDPCISRRQYYR